MYVRTKMQQSVLNNIISWCLIMTFVNNQKMASSEENKLQNVLKTKTIYDTISKDYVVSEEYKHNDDYKSIKINDNVNCSCTENKLFKHIRETKNDGSHKVMDNYVRDTKVLNNKVVETNEICPDSAPVSKPNRFVREGLFKSIAGPQTRGEHRRRHQRSRRRRRRRRRREKKVFSSGNCTSVVAQLGGTAVLHCEVHDITENTVTWIRRSDRALLSVGLVAFSADKRIYAEHTRHNKDWALHVRFAAAEDAGYYECQVPTHPPVSLFYNLRVVQAYAVILGEAEKVVQQGSALRLSCEVRAATAPPTHIFWYFRRRMLNYEREGVSVSVRGARSELSVRVARAEHAGRYTCAPHNARVAHVSVHVQPGESPAAIQHGSASSARLEDRPHKTHVLIVALTISRSLRALL